MCRVVVVAYLVFVVIFFFLYVRASHGTKTDVRARSMHTEQPPNNSGHFAIILLLYVVFVVVAMAGCACCVFEAKDRKRNPK